MTATSKTAFVDRSAYLGDPLQGDPTPMFRDETPDAETWPEGAVMAITFRREDFLWMDTYPGETWPQTMFYGADGWPVDLAPELTATLPDELRHEFQKCPWGWRGWRTGQWRSARSCPGNYRRSREEACALLEGPPVVETVLHAIHTLR